MDNVYEFERAKLMSRLPDDDLVESLFTNRAMIAGGAITSLFCNREINDLDIYFRTKEDFCNFILSLEGSGNRIIYVTKKAVLIANKQNQCLQAICFEFFDTSEKLFESFDFTCVMGAYDFADEKFHFHPDFLRHNSQRILSFNPQTRFPLISLLRVKKYQDKGYTISKPELLRVALTIIGLKIKDYEDFKYHIGGMYGVNYDNLIKPKEGEDFSIEKAVDQMQNLFHNDKYFDLPEKYNDIPFDTLPEILAKIANTKIPVFKFLNMYFYASTKNTTEHITFDPTIYEEVPADEDLIGKVYKFVLRTVDGKYKSFYDKNFEYVVGETAFPKGSFGLYFGFRTNLNNCTSNIGTIRWDKGESLAVLEASFNVDELKHITWFTSPFESNLTLKQVKILREVPKEEWKNLFGSEFKRYVAK